jgi:hypothetical protein
MDIADPILADQISGLKLQAQEARNEVDMLDRQQSAVTKITSKKLQLFSDLLRRRLGEGDPAERGHSYLQ